MSNKNFIIFTIYRDTLNTIKSFLAVNNYVMKQQVYSELVNSIEYLTAIFKLTFRQLVT